VNLTRNVETSAKVHDEKRCIGFAVNVNEARRKKNEKIPRMERFTDS